MKKSRFTEIQIVLILRETDAGCGVKELCRTHGSGKQGVSKPGGKMAGQNRPCNEITSALGAPVR